MMAPSPPRQAPSADPPQPPAATIDHLREEILPPRTRRRPRRQLSSTPAAAREPRRPPVRGEPPMAPSPPPGAPSADPPAAAKTTIHDVLEDIMRGILLRLHSSLSLGCAMLVCRSWAGIASKSGFHQSFRKTHPSSPLIGLFTNDDEDQYVLRPTVHVIHESDSDMAAVASKGDLLLYKLKSASGARWRIQDSRNGVLLLCRDDDNSLWVHNPVSGRQPVRIQDRPDDVTMDGKFVAHCLLDGTVQQCVAVDSFRVVSVQQFRREIRAVEYDSSTGEWHCHPRQDMLPGGFQPKWCRRPMYAAGHVFWKIQDEDFFMFVLETRTMEFSARRFPKKWKDPVYYSIGEIEDGKGYLVCPRGLSAENFDPRLQVWSINADNNMLEVELDLNKEVPMSQLAIPPNRSCNVYTVINGLAVVTYVFGPHFVVDLHKETLLATFSKKLSGRGYLYQLSWPHAINSGSAPPLQDNNIDNLLPTSEGSIRSSHDVMESVHEESDGDGRSKLIPGTKTKVPPTLSYLDNSNPTDDEAPKRKKRKATNTNNACPGETTRRTRSSHAAHDITSVEAAATSTPAARQISPQRGSPPKKSICKEAAHSKGARRTRLSHVVRDITSAKAGTTSMPVVRQTTCRNSSIGRPATQEKPVCKKSKRDRHCRVVHVQDKRIPYTFDSCYMKFKRLAHCDSHVKNIHNLKKTPLKCRFKGCREVFFVKHKRRIHEKSSAHVEFDEDGAERINAASRAA